MNILEINVPFKTLFIVADDWRDKLGAFKKDVFKITDEDLVPGRIIELRLNGSDGLILKSQYPSRLKYLVVLGVDSDRFIFGNVLINSDDYGFTDEMADHQYPIYEKDYIGLLEHKSYVDCSHIFPIERTRLKKFGINKGMMKESDFQDILKVIRDSELISPKEKKLFSL